MLVITVTLESNDIFPMYRFPFSDNATFCVFKDYFHHVKMNTRMNTTRKERSILNFIPNISYSYSLLKLHEIIQDRIIQWNVVTAVLYSLV